MIIPLDKIIGDYDLHIRGVIHIGAHWGEEYSYYKNAGIENIMFFEPVESNLMALISSVPHGHKGIRVLNYALGNETKDVDMYVDTTNQGQSSSVLEPGTHLTLHPWVKFTRKERVRMTKLDLIHFDRQKYNMINIDIQGLELECFKGAVETLPYIDIIYSEVNTEQVYKGCALIGEIDEFLDGFGFVRVFESFPYGKAWGDALYLKSR